MCTYLTVRAAVEGSAKGPQGPWRRLGGATVYFDHPVHAQAEHTLNIDFANPDLGPAARVAVELTRRSAYALIDAIRSALESAPEEPVPEGLRSSP